MSCRTAAAQRTVLGPAVPISLTLSARHDPDAYYRTRTGLYVWSEFRDRVARSAKPTDAGTTFNFTLSDLARDATDEEIEAALPKAHFFDESAVCAIVAELIATQPEGDEGHLLNSGHVNILYTGPDIVRVNWRPETREWSVSTWKRNDERWRAGYRALCPAD